MSIFQSAHVVFIISPVPTSIRCLYAIDESAFTAMMLRASAAETMTRMAGRDEMSALTSRALIRSEGAKMMRFLILHVIGLLDGAGALRELRRCGIRLSSFRDGRPFRYFAALIYFD